MNSATAITLLVLFAVILVQYAFDPFGIEKREQERRDQKIKDQSDRMLAQMNKNVTERKAHKSINH
jgi:hypothetical protein